METRSIMETDALSKGHSKRTIPQTQPSSGKTSAATYFVCSPLTLHSLRSHTKIQASSGLCLRSGYVRLSVPASSCSRDPSRVCVPPRRGQVASRARASCAGAVRAAQETETF